MTVRTDELTHEENYLLLELSYIDLNKGWLKEAETGRNLTLVEIVNKAKADPSINAERRQSIEQFAEKLEKKPKLHDITIIDYENHNKFGPATGETESGFVGYALADSKGNKGFLFRGTEWDDSTDMIDNISSGLTGNSAQVEYAKCFFDRHATSVGLNSILGHSKGGNVSGEVYVDRLDWNVKAYIVNGQPIYMDDLTEEQLAAIRGDNYTFIVHEGDIVSSLGETDYIDLMIPIKEDSWDFFYPHSLDSVAFDEHGNFVSSRKPTFVDYMLQGNLQVKLLMGGSLLGLSIIAAQAVAQRYTYEVVKWLSRISIAIERKLDEVAAYFQQQAIKVINNMIQLAHDAREKLKTWFNEAVQTVKSFVASIRARFRSGVSHALYSEHIELRTAQLRDLAFRLQRAQQRAQRIDSRLNDLAYLARLDKKLAVAWVDIGFDYSSDLRKLAEYLHIAADNFDRSERTLVAEANAL